MRQSLKILYDQIPKGRLALLTAFIGLSFGAAGGAVSVSSAMSHHEYDHDDDGVMRAIQLTDRELRMTNCVGTQAREHPDRSIDDITKECRAKLPEPLIK